MKIQIKIFIVFEFVPQARKSLNYKSDQVILPGRAIIALQYHESHVDEGIQEISMNAEKEIE
jgi:hypothetical protein